jgi:protein-S-isoprenylcysteine O-methyltransferase Ste14
MTTETNDNAGVRPPPPLLYLAGLLLGFLCQWAIPLPEPFAAHPVFRWVLGSLLVLACIPLAGAAVRLFRRVGNDPNPTVPVTAFVVTGPYRFTRNPMYLGLALCYAGVSLLAGTWWPLVFLAPVLVLIRRLAIDREEAYLRRTFGAAYEEYTRRVRRWL